MPSPPDNLIWNPLEDDAPAPRRAGWWIAAPAAIALLALAVLYYRQAVLHVPVPTRPLTGDVVSGTSLYFDWNELRDPDAIAHIQVSEARDFSWRAFEGRTVPGAERMRKSRILKPKTVYYWRMRTIRPGDRASPWTRKIRFTTE